MNTERAKEIVQSFSNDLANTSPAPALKSLHRAIAAALSAARREERTAIVQWLRDEAVFTNGGHPFVDRDREAKALTDAAGAIERYLPNESTDFRALPDGGGKP